MSIRENLKIPNQLVQNIIALYGDVGSKWLKDLPQFIFNYENQWQFKMGECFSDAQFNVVLTALKNDKTPVVFKCCV